MTNGARRAISAGVASLLVVALSGCTVLRDLVDRSLEDEPVVAETNTSTDEPVPAELERFYKQSLTWTWTGRAGETMVTVPLDWSDPAGDTIQIAVAVQRAAGVSHGSLLINPGGPGGAGYDYGLFGYGTTSAVADGYDIVGFDPRGVGRSTPVVCYEDPADQDELLFGSYDVPYGSEAWLAELTERELAWIQACQENTGPLLGHLDAGSVARDMDVIRAVLGDDNLDYLGYSYGTYLGTVYAELFPERVGRMVLDGAVDPAVGDLEWLAVQMAGFDSALRAYLADCLRTAGECPFSGTVEQGMSAVRGVLDGIDARRLVASDGRRLDSATLGTAIAGTLYSEWGWSALTEVFRALQRGDADPAFDEADAYYNRYAGFYFGNGNEVYVSVLCNEGDLASDGVGTLAGLDMLEDYAPVLGRYMGYDDYAVLDVACSHWPYPQAELPGEYRAAGAPPILVIGTTNDPATPYAQAVSLAAQLESGVLVSYQGEGHTIYAQGVSCIDNTVDAYLLRDVVPSVDPMC